MLVKLTPKQLEALKIVADGCFYPVLAKEEDGWYARWRAVGAPDGGSVDGWVDAYVREAAMTRLTEDAEEQKHETLHDAWMMALKSRTGRVVWNEADCVAFAAELAEWSGSAESDVSARKGLVFRFCAAGNKEEDSERRDKSVASPHSVPSEAQRGRDTLVAPEQKSFLLRCAAPRGRRALRALGQAAYVWGVLRGLRADAAGETHRGTGELSVSLTLAEAEDFLRMGAAALLDAGYSVEGLPERARVTASAELLGEAVAAPLREKAQGTVKLTVRVAGEVVSAEEIRFLLDQGSTLVYFRDHWIEVDRGILKEALRALEKGVGKSANLMSFAMGIGHVGNLEIEELKAHGWLRGLVNQLRSVPRCVSPAAGKGGLETPQAGTHCGTVLRPYQRQGVAWIRFLTDHGFGALLADDMGLGKTVQAIAWILEERGKVGDSERRDKSVASPGLVGASPVLIVAPLTLLANWRREFATFAPSLSVYVHQGGQRHLESGFRRMAAETDVVLTSYNLLVKDYSIISKVAWSALVLDEAQAIKNPDTQVARAVKALLPPKRLALTGTPIENTVRDVWSLEDFLNPGFLGDRKSFHERFIKPLAYDVHAAAAKRLSYAMEPFMLRRLKTDPGIAAEIGEKREVREYCQLGPDERRAYEAALAAFRATEHTPGDAFALLTELKQICDGRLEEGCALVESECGKLRHLFDLLASIFESGESALIFTQYAKVGIHLQSALHARFGKRYPFLHGALTAAQREQEIRRFNRLGPMAFILSLKAGGFGLNLTKATHVIHFDRWWNPAVENQATDRVHRIGQTKDVFVHLMITEGTVEERVDELLLKKSSLKDLLADGSAFWEAVKLT